jgi:hypothetical protein
MTRITVNATIYDAPVTVEEAACKAAGVRPSEVAWAEKLIDLIPVPAGRSITLVAFGDDGMYVHFKPLTRKELRDWDVWAKARDFYLDYGPYWPPVKAFRLALKARWPEAMAMTYPCVCCCDDLIEINACGYCGDLQKVHRDGCPCLLPGGSTFKDNVASPQFAAHLVYTAGYNAARQANTTVAANMVRRQYHAPGTSATWRMGVDSVWAYHYERLGR